MLGVSIAVHSLNLICKDMKKYYFSWPFFMFLLTLLLVASTSGWLKKFIQMIDNNATFLQGFSSFIQL
ncbi:MAG: hypothetical protein AAGB19_19575, partial [Cyanobacteria bacterium P01_F01_bin.3]